MADDQDNPGIRVPPPLIYLLALLLGLLLNRRLHVPFLSRGVARVFGWPLVGGGLALAAWFARTMHGADTTLRTDKPVSSLVQDGPFRYSRNPRLPLSEDALRRDSHSPKRVVGHPPRAVGGVRNPGRGDRARGALSGTHLRRKVPGLQGGSAPLGVASLVSQKPPSRRLGE
jgi:hypothetical protein